MSEFEAKWTRYRLVDREGVCRRLMKVAGEVAPGEGLRLLSSDDRVLDEEVVPPDVANPWHFGFWVPEKYLDAPGFVIECGGERAKVSPGAVPEGDDLPLRLDRVGPWLREHLERREALPSARDLADFVPDMAGYLHQHRIIYERPAGHWSEGLVLGNGRMGVVVTGERGAVQRFSLDHCDLWATTPAGRPIGRVYAGEFELRFDGLGGEGAFLQELSLYTAAVTTRDGDFESIARVNANHDVLEIGMRWGGADPLSVTATLTRPGIPMLEGNPELAAMCNGSWVATRSEEEVEQAWRKVESAPRTQPAAEGNVIEHRLPNMAYAIGAQVMDAEVEWREAPDEHGARTEATLTIAPGGHVRLLVAVASDREAEQPRERVEELLAANLSGHAEWWQAFWERSFVELPDKLMENLWYFGAYHQAAFSRGLQAPGFFALWHPLDYRTWDDAYVADAQTALMWWAPFGTNHLELLLPSHHTFGSMLAEFLEHNPGEGALVPHHFFPEWAGGHRSFGKPNPYKGSIGWFALNFWWDYVHTGDRAFLSAVAYPMIAACADFHSHDLVLEADGRYHCVDSGAPEQVDTARDNAYDHAAITAVLRAAVAASETLEVDEARRAAWRERLDRLFSVPCDAATLWETETNHHPYRCHPVVLFGVHPMGTIEPGDALWAKADATYDVVTNLFAFNPVDRHAAIPGHEGGVEPNGHAAAFLMHAAARLRGWREVRRLFHAVVARTQLKRNGLRAICDPRHSPELCNMAISEATSGQTSGMSEALVQSYSDHVRVFPRIGGKGVFRFAGLRAMGGFVLAGECADGVVSQVAVHSLRGGAFCLANPWPGEEPEITPSVAVETVALRDGAEALRFETEAGQTYRIDCQSHARCDAPPVVEERNGPRRVPCGDWEDFTPPIAYFPCDPPYGQAAEDGTVFLGTPSEEGASSSDEHDLEKALRLVEQDDWRARQTGARWLGRYDAPDARERLVELATGDEASVVRYTAAVALVAQGTQAGVEAAMRLAEASTDPYVRRIVLASLRQRAASADRE